MSEQQQASRVKELHKEAILEKPNVVGVGIGYKVVGGRKTNQVCLVVLVRQKLPPAGLAPEALVPREIDGIATDVIEVGDIRALQARTDRWRPAPGGVSVGHYQVTAGTLGCVVRDKVSKERLVLSNNHVLANSNDASPGDPILQPGAADGGQVAEDTIARLERFYPIQFASEPGICDLARGVANVGNALAGLIGSRHRLQVSQVDAAATNLVDAAVARPEKDSDIQDEILEIGVLVDTIPAMLGMAVRKSGRTTGLNTGEVTVLDATVTVSYGLLRTARFENQIVTSAMAQGGDSGSLLVAGDSLRAVGLLFAGSEQSAIHNPIQAVLDALEVEIGA